MFRRAVVTSMLVVCGVGCQSSRAAWVTAGFAGGLAATGTVVAATRPDHYCEAACFTPQMIWGAGAIVMATIAASSAISAIVLRTDE